MTTIENQSKINQLKEKMGEMEEENIHTKGQIEDTEFEGRNKYKHLKNCTNVN